MVITADELLYMTVNKDTNHAGLTLITVKPIPAMTVEIHIASLVRKMSRSRYLCVYSAESITAKSVFRLCVVQTGIVVPIPLVLGVYNRKNVNYAILYIVMIVVLKVNSLLVNVTSVEKLYVMNAMRKISVLSVFLHVVLIANDKFAILVQT